MSDPTFDWQIDVGDVNPEDYANEPEDDKEDEDDDS
jgi:hypothetical protein